LLARRAQQLRWAVWTVFLGWAVSILLLVLALRWLRDNVMWERTQSPDRYLSFHCGVPGNLAVAIAAPVRLSGLGDLAIFSAVSEIKVEANRWALPMQRPRRKSRDTAAPG